MATGLTNMGSFPTKGFPHVLVLPKWWPGPDDPQLGDFLRKQSLAVAKRTTTSVLVIHPDPRQEEMQKSEVVHEDHLWELHVHYRASTVRPRPLRKAINFVRYWGAARSGMRELLTHRGLPDLIHVHILVRPAMVAFVWARRLHIPFLLSEQSSEYLDGTYAGKSLAFKLLNKFLFNRSAGVTAVSDRLGQGMLQLGLCRHYTVVPNVVPGLDRPLPPPGRAGNFLVVADLVDRTKNVSGVLYAMAAAIPEMPSLDLTIIGDGPDRSDLETLVQQLGLGDRVRFLGRLPNVTVLDHMASAGAVIINSNVETFSVVTGEALAQGKPVIATRCGGPAAFITEENGYLIPVGDTGALAAHMVRLSREHANFDPATVRRSVGTRFSPEAVGEAFVAKYREILEKHHA